MAVTLGIGAGAAAAMAAGAITTAIRANKEKTKAKRVGYAAGTDYIATSDREGALAPQRQAAADKLAAAKAAPPPMKADGTVDTKAHAAALKAAEEEAAATNAQLDSINPYQMDFNMNRAESKDQFNQGQEGLSNTAQAFEQQRQQGLGLLGSASEGNKFLNAQGQRLDAYRPGEISKAMATNVLNQNAQANLGAARAGGALGLRAALNANAQAGVGASAQMAQQRAVEEQQHLQAQGNLASAQADAMQGQQKLGASFAQSSAEGGLNAIKSFTNNAANRENTYLAAEENMNDKQLIADMDYEQRRQAESQRRSQNKWNAAMSMMGGASKIAGSLGGSGGGG